MAKRKIKSAKRSNAWGIIAVSFGVCMLIGLMAPASNSRTDTEQNLSERVAAIANTRTSLPTDTARPTLNLPTDTPTAMVAMLEIIAESVNVRAGPSASYPKLGSLAKGARVAAIGKNKDGDWWQIDYAGERAWITADVTVSAMIAGDASLLPVEVASTLARLSSTQRPAATSAPIDAGGACSPCPSNCTQARAMGCSAQAAAACGLDRDGDGVACYGD